MATRAELLTQYSKLPAFRGVSSVDIEMYLDLALEAVGAYSPKKVKMKGIPGNTDGRYLVPSAAETLLGAFLVDTNIQIEMREEENAATGEKSYLLLGVQVPSWIGLMEDNVTLDEAYLPSGLLRYRTGSLAGSGADKHDLEFTEQVSVADLSTRQLKALRLYAESEGYMYQATKSENLSDITDREASGAMTTLRRSQSGNAFQKLAMQREEAFRREIARPYWTRDTWGTTERLWSPDVL